MKQMSTHYGHGDDDYIFCKSWETDTCCNAFSSHILYTMQL